jgi:cytochrome c-type biogenesis protein CcmE
MTRKQRRLVMIGTAVAVLGLALGLVLYAMRDSIVFFHAPADVQAKGVQPGTRFRLGGLVKEGSIKRGENQEVLPDLFREGQGVVAEGALDAVGLFKADTVLARHDETYMPREVADALKAQGHWQGEQKAKAKP